MGARPRTRPTRALPALHAAQLSGVVEGDDAVDLAVGVLVVLAAVDVLGRHVDGGDAEEARAGAGQADF